MSVPASWPAPPLIPGDWKQLSLADATAVLSRYAAMEVSAGLSPSAELVEYSRVRALRLTCAPTWLLIEAEARFSDGSGLLTLLYGPEHRMLGATWSPADLVETLTSANWQDGEVAAPLDYLRLFVTSMQGDVGRFITVESPDDVRVLCADGAELDAAVANVTALEMTEKDGVFEANGFVVYASALFRVTFTVTRDGMVSMTDDVPVIEVPLRAEQLRGAFRVRPTPAGT
jgi:hypothetical protein